MSTRAVLHSPLMPCRKYSTAQSNVDGFLQVGSAVLFDSMQGTAGQAGALRFALGGACPVSLSLRAPQETVLDAIASQPDAFVGE